MRSIRTRLELLSAGVACAGVLLLATPLACSGGLRAPIPAAHDEGDATPRPGGTLHLATVFDARNLDPAAPMDGLALQAVLLLFDGLVDIDHDGKVVPNLAEHWDVEDEGRSYRFIVRRGVLMHDGSELTADDVKRSFERALNPSTPSSVSSYFEGIVGYAAYTAGKAEHLEGVVADGRYVVTFRLEKPDAAFLSLLAMPAARPVCASAGNRYSRAWIPCGAGPFELAQGGWQRGSSLRVVRNPRYFRAGLPYLNAVEWTFLMDAVPQRFRFEDGQLDMLLDPTQADYVRFMADARWKPLGTPLAWNTVWGEAMNTRMAPFDRVEIRRAVAAAIDRDSFSKIKPANMAAASQIMPRGIPGYDPSWACGGHDEAAALEHMRKAGFPFDPATGTGGWPEPITYTVSEQTSNFFTAQILQQQLARIGLRIQLRLVNYPAYLAMVERIDTSPMAPWGNQADYADPSAMFDSSFTTAQINPEASNNVSFFSDRRYDEVVSRARHEMDPGVRTALYREANDILCDQAPWAFTWAQRDFVVRQPYVRGFAAHPIFPLDLRGVWLDR
jgi:ABC-type transport system substrate-binding protein